MHNILFFQRFQNRAKFIYLTDLDLKPCSKYQIHLKAINENNKNGNVNHSKENRFSFIN